ncbi:ice-binding family protein [Thiomicrorhabdus arctica]|uniref:ice-binding family protein n=1 Tax=Thiomicrorhabdus arctica TaxID=131540 RepID=UPI00037CFFF9|nr:ice-binding family protein [Thiomicrorhabdus arctica]
MNMIKKYTGRSLLLAGLVLTSLITGCNSSSGTTTGTTTGTAPTVVETAPINTVTDVALNSKVVVTFSEAMDDTTITTSSFTVVGLNESALTGTVSYDAASKTATFTADRPFTASRLHTATLSTAVKSATGQALAAAYVWSFTSGTAADAIAPTVVSTNPLDVAADVVINPRISATFSEAVHPATVNDSTFTLSAGGTSVSGVVSYSNRVASFTPTDNLVINTTYTATLTTGITDIAKPANALAAAKVWTFTTGSTVAKGPAPVNLRTAANFAIMTAAGITSAGSTTITGNIGTSPITGASITVACTELSAGSEMFTDNAEPVNTCVSTDKNASAIAIGDVGTAYTEAAAAPAGVGSNLNIGAGTVTAQTLVPGVYTWGTNVNLTGDITLDGGANDVWIFQVSGTLDLAASKSIFLTGGAVAKNVFWQASSTVTLNSAAAFKGNILAKTDIEMISGSTIDGRLLAQTEVRLGTTTVVTTP